MRFKKIFKSYLKYQWLQYCEQIWFNMVNTLHAKMSKLKHYWWMDNNYIEKPVTERLSQTSYDFSNI
jgi:hypothetical protein